jgi:hypothetical protein
MTDNEKDSALESHRPALQRLTLDLNEMREDLLSGFRSRADVLGWCQRLTIRSLGELEDQFYHELARQFRGVPKSGKERVMLSALLVPVARERDFDENTVAEFRQRLASESIGRAYHRAFRQLRPDAGEYVDSEDDRTEQSEHDPHRQRYVAMRPALTELEGHQQRVLDELLDGLEDHESILDWTEKVELATHGEIPPEFAERCYRENSTASLLTGGAGRKPARELFAAHHLIPAFNAGVRDMRSRAGEKPASEREEKEVPMA